MAYKKATRIAQERTQEEAQEVKRIKQEATADSRKAKKAEGYGATMEKLGKLPPCPKLCRGGECNGIPCKEEEPGFPYSHIDNMVVCHDKSHVSMATRDGCFLFHLWPSRKRSAKPPPPAGPPAGPPAKNSGGRTSGARHVPQSNRGNNQKTGKPRHAGNGYGTQRQQQQQRQPRGQQQQQQRNLDHRRAIKKLNLELEVTKTKANVLYASIIKGTPPPPLPPSRPQPQPQQQPQPQPRSTGNLERGQAFESLFTL
jgi:hypothetical protein